MLGAVATVALVVAVTLGYLGPRERPACACDVPAPMAISSASAAARFASLVRAGDVDGAWAMLTDTAHARYGDVAGFRPVAERLGATYAAGAESDWLLLSPAADGPPPVGGLVARLPAAASRLDPAAVVQQAIMVVSAASGGWRADPEPAIREVRAVVAGPKRLRVERSVTDRHRLGVWILDATGQRLTLSGAPDSYPVHKPGGPIANPLLAMVAGSTDGLTWWVGATTVTAEI